jgi:hypothetical protein
MAESRDDLSIDQRIPKGCYSARLGETFLEGHGRPTEPKVSIASRLMPINAQRAPPLSMSAEHRRLSSDAKKASQSCA